MGSSACPNRLNAAVQEAADVTVTEPGAPLVTACRPVSPVTQFTVLVLRSEQVLDFRVGL